MTYGENSGVLRTELGTLLRQHRIQHRLGGPGVRTSPVTTTSAERHEMGSLIGRYRHAVLVWCLQAVTAANPAIGVRGTSARSRGPADELRARLTSAVNGSVAGLPSMGELTNPQDFAIVESWRLAARAAALGEHDFAAGVGYGRLSTAECRAVMKDAADLTRGLVVLDRRYHDIPGWQHLEGQNRLGRAAEVAAVFTSDDEPDYSVDHLGWRPAPAPVGGPALPGLVGVLQAEHNLLIGLGRFPDAYHLRLVLDSQRVASHEAGLRVDAASPDLAVRWHTRAKTYAALARAARNLGGLLGQGGIPAGQGSLAISRIQRLDTTAFNDEKQRRHLDRLFTHVDEQIAAIIVHGAHHRLYFQSVRLPRVTDQSEGLVSPVRERFVPITSAVEGTLLDLVRDRLRPPPISRPAAPAGAARSRDDFGAAITHRPNQHGRGITD